MSAATTDASVDSRRVLIVGGGPTGMATALFLTARGVPVCVLERNLGPHDDPRAATYHPPSLELLEPSGVTAELHERGIVARTWQFRDRREGLIAEYDLGVLAEDTRYPYRLQCEQHKLTAMIQRRVAASPLAQIIHGAEVTDVAQTDAGVRVTFVEHVGSEGSMRAASAVGTAGTTRATRAARAATASLRGEWLVGADGGRSVVRKSQQIDFTGFTWPERFLVITTDFDFGALGYAYSSYTMDPDEWTATFKVPGPDDRGIWRSVFPTRAEDDERELLDAARAADRLAALVPQSRRARVVHTNLYAVHQRVALTYRRGRVLLAGDAAHVNNPLGGMGLNFGLHDAASLAERLARVWHGEADASLLDQYDRQRRAVAEQYLQAQTIANKQTLEERDPARREARKDEMRWTAADRAAARRYLLRTSMIEGLQAAAKIA
jgi:3-(3-hydroxy-phenyl)propionate hydroxylase